MVTVIIPPDLRDKAKYYRLNVSLICRTALAEEVRKCDEKEQIPQDATRKAPSE
jgi:post-segregation antitoxin (ccd killing protein)